MVLPGDETPECLSSTEQSVLETHMQAILNQLSRLYVYMFNHVYVRTMVKEEKIRNGDGVDMGGEKRGNKGVSDVIF